MMKKSSFKKLFSLIIMLTMIFGMALFGQISLIHADAAESDSSSDIIAEEIISEEICDNEVKIFNSSVEQDYETDEPCNERTTFEFEEVESEEVINKDVEVSNLFVEQYNDEDKFCDGKTISESAEVLEEEMIDSETVEVSDLSIVWDDRISGLWDEEENSEDEKIELKEVFEREAETLDSPAKQDYKLDESCDEKTILEEVYGDKDESWKHDKPPYESYLDSTPLRITGSEVKEPRTFALRQIESMTDGIIRDSFTSSGGSGNYEGLVLRYLIEQVGLKEGIDRPSNITVHAGPNFSAKLNVQDVYDGINSNYQPGEKRDVILAYAKDGHPLVPEKKDPGFIEKAENNYGPIKLIVENNINQWVKHVDEIIVGDGEYEEPKLNSKCTVKYLQLKVRDRDPDVEIEESKVFFGNVGDVITVEALDIPGWIPDTQAKKLILKEGENEIEFRYVLNVGLFLTGTNVSKDIYYTRAELEAIADDEQNVIRNYSVMKRGGIPAIIMGKGLDLVSFIKKADIVGEGNLNVLCRAVDGWSGSPLNYNPSTQSFGMERYYYPNIFDNDDCNAELVLPMLVFYNVEDVETAPEEPATKDGWMKVMNFPNPTLMFGQMGTEDYNNQFFAKMIFAIEVGNTNVKETLTVSGEEVEKPKTYRLDQILAKGLENKILGSNKREGISLNRILSDVEVTENAQIKIKTGGEEQVIEINAAEAEEFLLSLNVKNNIVDRESPLCIYYEKDGAEIVIENVTEIVCGKENDESKDNDGGDSPAPRPIPGPKDNSESNSDSAEPETGNGKENILSADDLETFDVSEYFEYSEIKEENGQQVEKIKVIQEGIKLIEEAPRGAVIPVNASQDANNVLLEMDGEFVNVAQENALFIQLNTHIGNYVISTTEFDLDSIAERLGCEKGEMTMNMAIALASNEKQNEIKDALPEGHNMLTEMVDFNVKFVFAEKEIKYNSFKDYIYHEMILSEDIQPSTTVGVYWDEKNKKLVPMPTIIVQRSGKTLARIYRKGNSLYAVISTEKTFEDMEDHWAQKDVELLGSKAILSGQTETIFKPDSRVTRAEFTVMLTRALGLTEQKLDDNFDDISGDEWFAGSVGAAVKENIISGFPDGTFKPEKIINRQEMAVMIANALTVTGIQECLEEEIDDILSRFEDNQKISDWAEEGLAITVELGIISGMPDGNFEPHDNATRAQAAVMIKGLLKVANFLDDRDELETNSEEIEDEDKHLESDSKDKDRSDDSSNGEGTSSSKKKGGKGSSGSSKKDDKSSSDDKNKDSSKDDEKDSKDRDSKDKDSEDSKLPSDTKDMIVIEGSAVKTPKAFSLSDLKNMTNGRVTANYFSRGRDTAPNPRVHTKCTGVSVYYLLTETIELSSTPSRVTVIAEDGYRQSFPIEEVAGYYMDETDPTNNALEMIIAWEQDGSEYSTSDGAPFRLIIGQKFAEEYNRLKWVRNVAKIKVE